MPSVALTVQLLGLRQGWASECPDVKNYKWQFNPVWHKMLYSCIYRAAVGIKGLTNMRKRELVLYKQTNPVLLQISLHSKSGSSPSSSQPAKYVTYKWLAGSR